MEVGSSKLDLVRVSDAIDKSFEGVKDMRNILADSNILHNERVLWLR